MTIASLRASRAGTRPDHRLARAVAARQLRTSAPAIALVLACTAAAGAFGRHLALRGLAPDRDLSLALRAAGSIGDMMLWQLGRAVALPFVMAAAYLVIDRIGDDEAQGWLAPLAAGGASRGEYLFAVTASAALAAGAAALLAILAFAGGVATIAPASGVAALRPAAGTGPLVLAAAAYGAACAAVARQRGRALALALGGLLLPVTAVACWQAVAGAPPSRLATRLLALHVPPFSWRAEPFVVLQHLAYTAVVLGLATRLARARLGRAP